MTKKKLKNKSKKQVQAHQDSVEPQGTGVADILTSSKFHTLIIGLIAFLLYANTLGHDYTQDDAIVIYDNMYTQDGISGIPGILTKDTFFGFFKEAGKEKLVSGGRYRPFTLIMFAVEWQIFGKNPFIGHLVNILLYAFLCIMIYKTLTILFLGYKSKIDAKALTFVFLATLLYTCHPIHTEAVANIKGRDEIMTFLGSIIALYSIFKYHYSKQIKWMILSFVSFFVALMSKENAITFLAIVPLAILLFIPKKENNVSHAIKYTVPFVLSTILFLIIRFSILGMDLGGTPNELMNNPFLKIEGNQYVAFSLMEKLATIIYTLGKYVVLLIFPHPLSHDYYPRTIDIMQFSDWQVIVSTLLYLGLGVSFFIFYKKDKYLSFAILFYLATLSIVSNIVFPIGTNMSERFIFMPSLGYTIIIARLLTKYISNNKLIWTISGILLLGYSIKTISRNNVWKNDFTLFTTDVQHNDKSAKLLNAAGGALSTEAAAMTDGPKKTEYLNKAIGYLEKAVKIHPSYRNAYLLLGNSYYYLKDYEKSILYYDQALKYDPDFTDAAQNLAIVLREGGRYMGQKEKNYALTEKWLTRAVGLNPQDYESTRLLGITYGVQGQHQKAITYFQKAIDLRPDIPDNYTAMGTAYQQMGNMEKAKEYYNKAVELDPKALNRLVN